VAAASGIADTAGAVSSLSNALRLLRQSLQVRIISGAWFLSSVAWPFLRS